jgi:type IV secretion system protein TrbI
MTMSKEDPDRLALRAKPKPVTRLNRRTLVVAAAVIAAGILGVSLWSLQPKSAQKNEATVPVVRQAQKVSPAEGLATLPSDYANLPKTAQSVPQLGSPLGELGRPVLRAEEAAGLEPLDARNSYLPNPNEDAVRVDRLQQVQEAATAAKAQVFFQLSRREAAQSAKAATSAAESDFDRAMKMTTNALAANTSGAAAQGADGTDQNLQSNKQSFLKQDTDANIYSSGTLQTPRSPYQVMAGTVISAALVTGINSDLPGQIIATVTENIYDSVAGRYLLVPQGSRLLGQYDSQVAYGQSRVLLVWIRLLLPDGSSIVLDRLSGVDAAGQAGLEDKVNWHWARIFEGAALSTLIGVGAELAAPKSNGNSVTAAGRESIQSTITEIGQQITRRNLNIQPTITVRAGFPVRVIVNKDLVLRPFQGDARNLYTRTP